MRSRNLFGPTGIPLVLALSLVASLADARVVRFVVEQRRVFAEGMVFGSVGPYERLDGTVYMEVDRTDPLNAAIVNVDSAPRNARKMVEFSSPFFILKPVDMSRGNGKIFYGVNNRGNKLESGLRWNYVSASNNPLTATDAGDGFLMRLGYTIVDAGWQGDVVPGNDRVLVPQVDKDGLDLAGIRQMEAACRLERTWDGMSGRKVVEKATCAG